MASRDQDLITIHGSAALIIGGTRFSGASAQADVDKTINQIENQVDVAYQNLVQSRRLVEAYLAGILEDSGLAFTMQNSAYQRGGIDHFRFTGRGAHIAKDSTVICRSTFYLQTM